MAIDASCLVPIDLLICNYSPAQYLQQIDFGMCGANTGTGNLLQYVILSVKGTEQ